jgi:hypothetical protein
MILLERTCHGVELIVISRFAAWHNPVLRGHCLGCQSREACYLAQSLEFAAILGLARGQRSLDMVHRRMGKFVTVKVYRYMEVFQCYHSHVSECSHS